MIRRLFIYFLMILSCTSCGWLNRIDGYISGHSFECVDGVLYLQFPSGASVAYDTNGKVKTCASGAKE